ncbi:unnamed protein product [Tilletia controversa]|nr:unnamed protein product [Tilletia controversa]CAD6914895.1 unnamed protein product [Tilletia controversa]CAD6972165.1 unnamed protein product [Tilletia controversa]
MPPPAAAAAALRQQRTSGRNAHNPSPTAHRQQHRHQQQHQQQPWLSPATSSSPSSPSVTVTSTAPSLSPFDTMPTHKTPASRPTRPAATHTNSPPSSLPSTMLPLSSKRTRKPSVKAREMAFLNPPRPASPDGLASAVGVRKRAFTSATSRDDDNELPDESPCIPRRKRARNTQNDAGSSTALVQSPPFWVEIPLRNQTKEDVKHPPSTASKKSDMAAPLSTIPLRRQQKEQQEKEQQGTPRINRATTPPSQMARNRSPPPPPASALRLANFGSSSRERRQHQQRHNLVRTASGFEPTPSGPSRLVDLNASPTLDDDDQVKRPSPIEFISPSQLGAILRNPNSSSSKTRTKDATSYMNQMAGESSGSSESRSRSRDMLKLALLGKDKVSPPFARLSLTSSQEKSKGKARAIDPVSPTSSPFGPSSQPRSSPTNPLGADVEAVRPVEKQQAPKPVPASGDDVLDTCSKKYGPAFVTRSGWPVEKWMELETPARREAQAKRRQVEVILGLRGKDEEPIVVSSPARTQTQAAEPTQPQESKTSPVRQVAESSAIPAVSAPKPEPKPKPESESPKPKKRIVPPITDQERLDFNYGYYGHKFATKQGWSEERYLILKSPERKRARAARAEMEVAMAKGTAIPLPPVRRPQRERLEFYEDRIRGDAFVTSHGWKEDGLEIFPRPPKMSKRNRNLDSPPPGMSIREWWSIRESLPPRYETSSKDRIPKGALEMGRSRELPPLSFYAQNKREEASPSPPSRRVVSEQFEDLVRMAREQEREEGDGEEEDELEDEDADGEDEDEDEDEGAEGDDEGEDEMEVDAQSEDEDGEGEVEDEDGEGEVEDEDGEGEVENEEDEDEDEDTEEEEDDDDDEEEEEEEEDEQEHAVWYDSRSDLSDVEWPDDLEISEGEDDGDVQRRRRRLRRYNAVMGSSYYPPMPRLPVKRRRVPGASPAPTTPSSQIGSALVVKPGGGRKRGNERG